MSQLNLTARLKLDTQGFTTGISDAEKSVSDFTKNAEQMGSTVSADMKKIADAANDAGRQISELGRNAALEQVEAEFQKLSQQTPKTKKEFESLKESYKSAMEAMSRNGLANTDQYAQMRDGLAEVEAGLKRLKAESAINVDSDINSITENAANASAELSKAERLAKKILEGGSTASEKNFEELTNKIAILRDRVEEGQKKFEEFNAEINKKRGIEIETDPEPVKTLNEQLKEAENQLKAFSEGTQELSSEEVEQLVERIAELRDETAQSSIQFNQLNDRIEELRKVKLNTDKDLNKIKTASEKAKERAGELRKQLEQVLEKNGGNIRSEEVRQLADEIVACDRVTQRLNTDIDRALSRAKGFNITEFTKGLDSKLLGGAGSQLLGALATPAGAATAAVAVLGKTLYDAGKAAADFETHLDSLQALTGMTAEEMQIMSDKALTVGNEFGMMAEDVVDSMKLIGSQAPELLKNGDALEYVTKNAATLSKAAQIDINDAASVITTAMNQMGVSASQTGELINALAAGSQQGAADLTYLQTTFEKAGTSAKQAGMDFTSLTALVETVAPKFSSADVAGTALNSVLLKLSMSGKKEFMPSVVGMSEALNNLAKAEMDDAEMKKLVGESGITMLKALIDGRDTFNSYNESLRDTNTAQEQFEINTGNMQSSIDKLKASWHNFLITLGQSGIMQELAGNIQKVVEFLIDTINKVGDVIDAFKEFDTAGESVNIFKLQLDMLKRTIDSILTAVEIVVRAIAKAWNWCADEFNKSVDYVKTKWDELKSAISKVDWLKSVYNAFKSAIESIGKAIDWLEDKWNKFLDFIGVKVDKAKPTLTDEPAEIELSVDTTDAEKAIDEVKNKASKSVKEAAEKGSISGLRNEIQKLDKMLSDKKLSDDRIKQIQKEKSEIQNQIDLLELRNRIAGQTNGIKQMQEAYSALGVVLENCNLSAEEIQKTISDRTELEKVIRDEKLRRGLLGYQKDSLSDQQYQLSEIENKLKNINLSEEERNRLVSQRDKLRSDIEKYQLENNLLDYEKDSLSHLQNEYQKLINLRTNKNVSDAALKELNAEIDKVQQLIDARQKALGLEPAISQYKPSNDIERQRDNLSQSRQNYTSNFETWRNQVKAGDMDLNEFRDRMNEMKSMFLSVFPDSKLPLEFVIEDSQIYTAMESLERLKEKVQSISDSISTLGSAFGSLGGAIGGSTGELLKFTGSAIESVSKILPLISKTIAAKQAEATANAISSVMLPFPFNLPAIASVVATITSLFASLPKFAHGGIVPNNGVPSTGDNMLIRANPGELVLTQSQQSQLFRMLNSGNTNSGISGDVVFHISGDTLSGVLNNHNKRMSKIK